MPKRAWTPNCTHIDMDRVYKQDQQCYVCGRSPSIGFLYECKQDCASESLHGLLSHEHVVLIQPVKSDLRLELQSIGLSESIILTAEGGHYTDAQLNKLRNLKLELRQTIFDVHQASRINDAIAKLTAIANAPPYNDSASNNKLTKDLNLQACAFKACHQCRPYYRERIYISIQAVLSADFAPMTRDDIQELPTKSSQVMRNLGCPAHPLPSSPTCTTTAPSLPTSASFVTSTDAPQTSSTTCTDSSELTFKTTQTDMDETTTQRRPRRRFYKMGRRSSGDIARDLSRLPTYLTREGLKSAVRGIFRPGKESSSSGSNITLPLPRTGTVHDLLNDSQLVGERDLGALRRVRKQKERNELKNGTYTGGFEGVRGSASVGILHTTSASSHAGDGDGADQASNSGSEFLVYSCASEGSKVELDGRVALTEGAVETHTPNSLAFDVLAVKHEAMCQAEEVNDEKNDAGADIGLQNIMTRV